MIARLTALALCAMFALPALAQITPAETNLDEAAGRHEARSAQGRELTAVSPDEALANALRRCDNLPEFYRADCIARVKGEGAVSGSVIGGGLIKESVTTLPKGTLEDEIRNIPPVRLPPQQ